MLEGRIPLTNHYEKNLTFFKRELGADESFDVIIREFMIMRQPVSLIAVDGMVKDEELTKIMQSFSAMDAFKQEFTLVQGLKEIGIPYIEMNPDTDLKQMLFMVLSGAAVLLASGCPEGYIIDVRKYPARNTEEPEIERVVRGAHDGFTETIVYNTALIRRRLRDPHLRSELFQVGNVSQTDVAVLYLKGKANDSLLNLIKDRIRGLDVDGIPMAEKSLEELIVGGSRWNPFPKVRYTERPDIAASYLMEGHVLLLVDTSPSVMIAPATFFHHLQHAEEYRQIPVFALYTRWLRFLAVFASVFLSPLWLLAVLEPQIVPPGISFIGPQKIGFIPLLLQLILADLAVDLMRMAAIHTPSQMATSLGVIAALLIGDMAVDMGIFAPEVLMYSAVAAVCIYATPSYELALTNRCIHYCFLVAVGFWQGIGFSIVWFLVLTGMIFTKSFNVPYLWPLIPFNARGFFHILVRMPRKRRRLPKEKRKQ